MGPVWRESSNGSILSWLGHSSGNQDCLLLSIAQSLTFSFDLGKSLDSFVPQLSIGRTEILFRAGWVVRVNIRKVLEAFVTKDSV